LFYPLNCIIALISIQNTNGVLDWPSASILHQCKILIAVMIQPAERQVRYKTNDIFFPDRDMDHIQSFGSIMHDAWNMLSSKIKSEYDMLKEDSQTIFLMQRISLRILWACVWISVCISVLSFWYMKPSILPHAIERNLLCKAPQFSSTWYVNNFRPPIPSLSQQDTSVKASDRWKWIFLNKQTRGEASQVWNSSFSSTIIRPSFGCKLSRFLLHATQTKASSRI